MSDVEVRNNPKENRYEAWLDDELAGIAVYELKDDAIVFTHTEVGDAFGGRGVGSALAHGAMEDVRAGTDRRVIAVCPFIKGYLDKHPEYHGLLSVR